MSVVKSKYFNLEITVRLILVSIIFLYLALYRKGLPTERILDKVLVLLIYSSLCVSISMIMAQIIINYHIYVCIPGTNKYFMSVVNSTVIDNSNVFYWGVSIIEYNRKSGRDGIKVMWSSIHILPLLHFVCVVISIIVTLLILI